jgi:hypothetical protein
LTQGWQIKGITRFSTGFPIQMNQANGDDSLAGSSATDMPNLIGKVKTSNPRNAKSDCPPSTTWDVSSSRHHRPRPRIRTQVYQPHAHSFKTAPSELLASPTDASSTALDSTTLILA